MKRLFSIFFLVCFCCHGNSLPIERQAPWWGNPPAGAAALPNFAGQFTLTNSVIGGNSAGSDAVSSPIDTTGTKFAVASCSRAGGAYSFSDSASNTWHARFNPPVSGAWPSNQVFDCTNFTSSATHTFTLAGGGVFSVLCFACPNTAYFLEAKQAGNASSTSFQSGSLSPHGTNLFVAAHAGINGAFDIDSAFSSPVGSEIGFNAVDLWASISFTNDFHALNPTWSGAVTTSGTASLLTYGCAPAAPSGYTLIAHTTKAGNANTVTTDPIDTRGATLIIVAKGYFTATPTLTDSQSNTKTGAGTIQGAGNLLVQIDYYVNPTTDAAHTFTLTGTSTFPGLCVLAFSGNAASPFDVEDGSHANTTTATRQAFNPITPSVNGSLVVTAVTFGLNTFTPTIDSGFSTPDSSADGSAVNFAMAYKIQATAASINPTWTVGNGSDTVASGLTLMSFKPQ